MSTPDLRGWLPISIRKNAPAPVVEWCRFGARRFTESFFDHTVQNLMRDPFHLLFRHETSLDTLLDWQRECPGIKPAGFIYHMSRCGSTLVAQMLAALPEHIVLSEPPPLGDLLRLDGRGASDEQRIAWLRAWLGAMSQPRNGEQRLYVKLEACHTFDLPLLHRAFPDTPWIFMHRNPVEVMVSALKIPGKDLVPNLITMNAAGISPDQAESMSQAEYIARTLAALLRAALDHLRALDGLALDYATLPASVIDTIAPHFRLALTPAQIAVMNERAAFHAKELRMTSDPDSQSKQREASDEVRALCTEHLDPLYTQLRAP